MGRCDCPFPRTHYAFTLPRGANTALTMGSKGAPAPRPACESGRKPEWTVDPALLPFLAVPLPRPLPGWGRQRSGLVGLCSSAPPFLSHSTVHQQCVSRHGPSLWPGATAVIRFSDEETEAQEHQAWHGITGTPSPEALTPTLDLIPRF